VEGKESEKIGDGERDEGREFSFGGEGFI